MLTGKMPANTMTAAGKELERAWQKRTRPAGCQRFAEPGEIFLIAIDRSVRVAQQVSCALRDPASDVCQGDFIVREQISEEPPFERRRGKKSTVEIEERTDLFGGIHCLEIHRATSAAAIAAGFSADER